MAQFKGIPILSGEKYRTPQGFTAIKDGIKATAKPPAATGKSGARKPSWQIGRAHV